MLTNISPALKPATCTQSQLFLKTMLLDAWSAEADISESDAAPSRPSSAAAMYRQALTKPRTRPATAPGKRPLPLPVPRPLTAPSHALKQNKSDLDLIDVPSTSGVDSGQPKQETAAMYWPEDKKIAITNGVQQKYTFIKGKD